MSLDNLLDITYEGERIRDIIAERDSLRAELAIAKECKRNDDAERERLWQKLTPYLDAETHGKTWADIIILFANRLKAAAALPAVSEAEIAAWHKEALDVLPPGNWLDWLNRGTSLMRRAGSRGDGALLRLREWVDKETMMLESHNATWVNKHYLLAKIDELLASQPEPKSDAGLRDEPLRECVQGLLEVLSDAKPHERLEDLPTIFTMDCKRQRWVHIRQLTREIEKILAEPLPAPAAPVVPAVEDDGLAVTFAEAQQELAGIAPGRLQAVWEVVQKVARRALKEKP